MTEEQDRAIHEIRSDVTEIKREIRGFDGSLGLAGRVAILWRVNLIFPVSLISTIGGVAATLIVKHYFP
jgi:hypothetical protein